MTGNDIVDMRTAAAESNWKRKGFLDKIFTPAEQQYITASPEPDQMVWRLWSMKESVYKIHVRLENERLFAPLKFQCSIEDGPTGTVRIHDRYYDTFTTLTREYVYSIACPDNERYESSPGHCFCIPPGSGLAAQQQFIYRKIIAAYTSATGKKEGSLSIFKTTGNIPWLCCGNEGTMIPVSITHHGRYAAFTINHHTDETIPFLVC